MTQKFLAAAALALCFVPATAAAQSPPLFEAARKGDQAEVTRLIGAGADVNARIRDGGTALMIASQNGHVTVVTALLAVGADVNAKANSGATALLRASQEGRYAIVVALLAAGAK